MKKASKVASIIILFWLAGYIAFAVNAASGRAQDEEIITDAIVVVTGGNHRITTGLDLFARGRAAHLFISGVDPRVTRKNITSLWDGETALPPCCITLGREASTTIQNAQEVRQWLQVKSYSSIRLVTSPYHMPRALMEFRHALPGIEIIASPVTQKDYGPGEWHFWRITFGEYNKTLVRSLTLALVPKPKSILSEQIPPLSGGGSQGEGLR